METQRDLANGQFQGQEGGFKGTDGMQLPHDIFTALESMATQSSWMTQYTQTDVIPTSQTPQLSAAIQGTLPAHPPPVPPWPLQQAMPSREDWPAAWSSLPVEWPSLPPYQERRREPWLRDLPMRNYLEEDSRESFTGDLTSNSSCDNKRKREEFNLKPMQHSTPLEKPKKTYVEMIARVMLTATDHRMVIADIYTRLELSYPYFKESTTGSWKGTARHCLSAYDCFVRTEKRLDKSSYWAIHPACVELFKEGKFKKRDYQAKINGPKTRRLSPSKKRAKLDAQFQESSCPGQHSLDPSEA